MESKEQQPHISIEEELKNSYLTYAMSVIVSRALPDTRDGLKPSQRRVLLAMHDLNLGPHSKFRKCAKIAGDTSGNYHPHGESVIYPTLVRMAQNFNMRYRLIDGQGNFGSLDGDPPAAMRYTEARMTAFATQLLEDIEKDTVDFMPNYDETRKEPTVFPSKFPNLLVNGSVGIAVGMSTSIPPHNLTEVCNAIVRVIDKPDVEIGELCQIIKGPDFPTGATICGVRSIWNAYKTGKGIIKVRAKYHVEEKKNGRLRIIFTEIPYQVNKARVLEKIAELVKKGKIKGISDVRDESDRKEAVRIVVDLKKNENDEVILNQLFKFTSLQTTFSIIMIALVDGRPQLLGIKDLIQCFIRHRQEVIRRRTQYLLNKAERRAHILEGLMIAIRNIEDVVDIIRNSEDSNQAKDMLAEKYNLTPLQTDSIMQMRLSALTGLEHGKLQSEYADLQEKIKELKEILSDEQNILNIIKEETTQIRDKYGDARRTEISDMQLESIDLEDIIPNNHWLVLVTHHGYIKRMLPELYRTQLRGGSGVITADMNEGDFVEHFFVASAHQYILFFTDLGRIYWLKVYDIPECSRTAKGRAIVNLLNLQENESITTLIPISKFDDRYLMMATEHGVVKKTALAAYSRPMRGGIKAITLDDNDRLVNTVITTGNQGVVLGSLLGKACRFHEKDARSLGRVARGVRGVRLKEDDKVIGLVVVKPDEALLTITENGCGKCTQFDDYRITRRGGQGVINLKRTDKTGNVVSIMSVKRDDEIMIITLKGKVIRISAALPILSRNTQGVRVIRLKDDDLVVSVAKLAKEVIEESSESSEVPTESINQSITEEKTVEEKTAEEKTVEEKIEK